MELDVGLGIAATVVLGTATLWLAARLRVTAIIPLLVVGVIAGPVTGVVKPQEMFGDAFFPAVSVAVALLLFDGGLGLRWRRLEHVDVVVRLVTVGALVTMVIGTAGAVLLLSMPVSIALLLGSILVVSGPTVVLPILSQVRVRDPAATVLRWEGIIIDPIGATLAVIMLNIAIAEGTGFTNGAIEVVVTVLVGCAAGVAGAVLLVGALRFHLVPGHLHVPVAIGMVVLAFEAANLVQPEAGLFATTLMGVLAANQRRVPIGHIVDFGESLGQLLLALLFVTLGASLEPGAFGPVFVPTLGLVAILVLVARPLAVFLSAAGTAIPGRQRLFMAWMAPRGIVAASVAAVFALELEHEGIDPGPLAPATFIVIVCTVLLYGFSAKLVSRKLQLEVAPARGLVVVGTPDWALDLGAELSRYEIPLLFVATAEDSAERARERGFLVYAGEPTAEDLAEVMDSVGASQVVAADLNDEFNKLVLESLARKLDRANLYWLPARPQSGDVVGAAAVARGQLPFEGITNQVELCELVDDGWEIVSLPAGVLRADDRALIAVGADGLRLRPGERRVGTDEVIIALRLDGIHA